LEILNKYQYGELGMGEREMGEPYYLCKEGD
jgi:hypothetical protein